MGRIVLSLGNNILTVGMNMLLYIEDNAAIAENVITYLETDGYKVKRCADGTQGLDEALSGYYDCIVLDVMLPGVDGFTLCREVRKHKQTPIIMTTAKGEIEDKGAGFSGGADDYLVKPFELAELVMRIESLVKRTQVSDIMYLGDIEIHIDENRCIKNGNDIHLTGKEWQLLITLLDGQGVTVTRADLVEDLRGGDALYQDNEGTLDVYIANLRKKLGKEQIVTVKGVGYRIQK